MNCKICNSGLTTLFSAKILNKYETKYYKCNNCGFIQTEEPFWLNEAYASAITDLDLGLLSRNLVSIQVTSALLNRYFNSSAKFIDFGGGYGVFTRLMRDKGFDFYRYDIHCENLFSRQFDMGDLKEDTHFELATAFEVFEHLVNPKQELEKVLSLSESVFFSTELLRSNVREKNDWWYFMPETGQHIAFYTIGSLQYLAKLYNLNFYTNNNNLHLFSKKKISPLAFRLLTKYKVAKVYNWVSDRKPSLLSKDFKHVLEKIQNEH